MCNLLNVYLDNIACSRHRKLYPKDDLYFRISSVFMGGDIACDRFNFLHGYSKYRWGNIQSTLPQYTNKTFKEICIQHACELIKQYHKIGVLWSGGVDSTALIFILLESGVRREDLTIVATQSSINEAPQIFEYLVINKFNVVYFDNSKWIFDLIDELPVDIVLTGSNADQLFCRGYLVKHLNNLYTIQTDWKDRLKVEYNDPRFEQRMNKYADHDVECLQYYQKQLNWECKTWAELSNLVNFCFHWEFVTRFFKSQSLYNMCSKTQGFYTTQLMQDWSYTNRHKLADYTYRVQNGQYEYYKKDLKDIIHEHTHIDSYYFDKLKGDSIKFYKRDVRPPYYPFNIIDDTGSKMYKFPSTMLHDQYIHECFKLLDEYLK